MDLEIPPQVESQKCVISTTKGFEQKVLVNRVLFRPNYHINHGQMDRALECGVNGCVLDYNVSTCIKYCALLHMVWS